MSNNIRTLSQIYKEKKNLSQLRKCNKCNISKDKNTDFYKDTSICKSCKKDYNNHKRNYDKLKKEISSLREEVDECYKIMDIFEERLSNIAEKLNK